MHQVAQQSAYGSCGISFLHDHHSRGWFPSTEINAPVPDQQPDGVWVVLGPHPFGRKQSEISAYTHALSLLWLSPAISSMHFPPSPLLLFRMTHKAWSTSGTKQPLQEKLRGNENGNGRWFERKSGVQRSIIRHKHILLTESMDQNE